MARRIDRPTACAILDRAGARGRDFYALPSSSVDVIVEAAKRVGYRKPKNANGSRGRYFYAYLERVCR